MKYIPLFLAFGLMAHLSAQPGLDFYDNVVYDPDIKSLKFHVNGLPLTFPLLEFGSGSQFRLSFDDLSSEPRDFSYTIVHCNQDWTPSQLTQMEYNDGYAEDFMNNYQFSFKSLVPYVHYDLLLPNDNISWTKPGNYALVAYEDDQDQTIVFTQRFVIAEQRVKITPQLVRPNIVSKSRTHQEIDFQVDLQEFKVRNPRQEIRAVVLQNGRWDTATDGLPAQFIRDKILDYDYQNKIIFPAGKEFRNLDMRSLRNVAFNISAINRDDEQYTVTLYKSQPRDEQVYLEINDLNGNFVIESQDQQNTDLASEYAEVLFSFQADTPLPDKDLYLLGGFTNYQLTDAYRMVYNNAVNAYVLKVMIKQGFYDFIFATVPSGKTDQVPELSQTEGNWYETENDYTILVYYRPFGARFDRVIGALTFSTN